MTFRNATITDLAAIHRLENECFPPNEAASLETLSNRLQVFPHHFWLLENEGQLIGFINGMVTDNKTIVDEMFTHTHLHNENGSWQSVFGLAVAPAYRRQGYAEMLINHLIKRAKAQNRKGITLTCKAYLIPYYKKLGFTDTGLSASVHGGEVWHDMVMAF